MLQTISRNKMDHHPNLAQSQRPMILLHTHQWGIKKMYYFHNEAFQGKQSIYQADPKMVREQEKESGPQFLLQLDCVTRLKVSAWQKPTVSDLLVLNVGAFRFSYQLTQIWGRKQRGSVEFYKILAQIGGGLFVTHGKHPGKTLLKVTQEEVGSLITIVALK